MDALEHVPIIYPDRTPHSTRSPFIQLEKAIYMKINNKRDEMDPVLDDFVLFAIDNIPNDGPLKIQAMLENIFNKNRRFKFPLEDHEELHNATIEKFFESIDEKDKNERQSILKENQPLIEMLEEHENENISQMAKDLLTLEEMDIKQFLENMEQLNAGQPGI